MGNNSSEEIPEKDEEERIIWPNGVIPYEIDHSLDYNWHRISKAMETIEKNSSFRFKKRTNEECFLEMSKENGCWFRKRDVRRPRISLGINCEDYRIVLHELLHAIGFPHEHRRPDRDEYVTIYKENIKEGKEAQFTKLKPGEYQWSDFPFDYNSIMLYASYAFSKNGFATMTTKDGRVILPNEDLSELDKKKLRFMN